MQALSTRHVQMHGRCTSPQPHAMPRLMHRTLHHFSQHSCHEGTSGGGGPLSIPWLHTLDLCDVCRHTLDLCDVCRHTLDPCDASCHTDSSHKRHQRTQISTRPKKRTCTCSCWTSQLHNTQVEDTCTVTEPLGSSQAPALSAPCGPAEQLPGKMFRHTCNMGSTSWWGPPWLLATTWGKGPPGSQMAQSLPGQKKTTRARGATCATPPRNTTHPSTAHCWRAHDDCGTVGQRCIAWQHCAQPLLSPKP